MAESLTEILAKFTGTYAPVVPFDPATDRLLKLDFTSNNEVLTPDILADTEAYSQYVDQLLGSQYTYGIGGYNEHRTIYSRSTVFDAEEPRRLHLGVDIWGPTGTIVSAPLDGVVHSFAFNDLFGDYGATIILQHQLNGILFHTLYGHLALRDLSGLEAGKFIRRGVPFAHFGPPEENGHWPPHLHFQLIEEMGTWKGDYPGVSKFSEREVFLANCADPDLVLDMMRYAEVSEL